MIQAEYSDKEWIVDAIADAFQDNRSALWVVKQDEQVQRRIRHLIEYAFERSFRSGGTMIDPEKRGALLYKDPNGPIHRFKNTLDDIWLARKAVGLGRALKVLKREAYVERHHPTTDFIHLWFIGVKKAKQGEGIGARLLEGLNDLSDQRDQPIYLETSAPETLAFYQTAGYEIYHEWNDEFLGFPLWFLRRYPNTRS